MKHLHLKDLHLGNWCNRNINVGGGKSGPVFEPIKLEEQHFIELYAEMNPNGLCFQDLYPIELSRDVVSKIDNFRLVKDTDNDIDWHEFKYHIGNIMLYIGEKDDHCSYHCCDDHTGREIKEFATLHELQTFIRVTSGIELQYDPYKK